MLSPSQLRQIEANRIARRLVSEYGDGESASDRVLAYCNGVRWLERLVRRELRYISNPPRQRYRNAA